MKRFVLCFSVLVVCLILGCAPEGRKEKVSGLNNTAEDTVTQSISDDVDTTNVIVDVGQITQGEEQNDTGPVENAGDVEQQDSQQDDQIAVEPQPVVIEPEPVIVIEPIPITNEPITGLIDNPIEIEPRPIGQVTHLVVTADENLVTLQWVNPPNMDTISIRYGLSDYPKSVTDGMELKNLRCAADNSILPSSVTELVNSGDTYYFSVFVGSNGVFSDPVNTEVSVDLVVFALEYDYMAFTNLNILENLYKISVDQIGKQTKTLVTDDILGHVPIEMAQSPNGLYFAYPFTEDLAFLAAVQCKIIDGNGNMIAISAQGRIIGTPSWSPNSNAVVFCARSENTTGIYKLSIDGQEEEILTWPYSDGDSEPVRDVDYCGQNGIVYLEHQAEDSRYAIWAIDDMYNVENPILLYDDEEFFDGAAKSLHYIQKDGSVVFIHGFRMWRLDSDGNLQNIASNGSEMHWVYKPLREEFLFAAVWGSQARNYLLDIDNGYSMGLSWNDFTITPQAGSLLIGGYGYEDFWFMLPHALCADSAGRKMAMVNSTEILCLNGNGTIISLLLDQVGTYKTGHIFLQ